MKIYLHEQFLSKLELKKKQFSDGDPDEDTAEKEVNAGADQQK